MKIPKIPKHVISFVVIAAIIMFLLQKKWPQQTQRNIYISAAPEKSSKTVAIFFGSAAIQFELLNMASNTSFFESISVLSEFNPDQRPYNQFKLQTLDVADAPGLNLKAISNVILMSVPYWPFYDPLLEDDFTRLAQLVRLAVDAISTGPIQIKLFAVEPFINGFHSRAEGGGIAEWKRQLKGTEVFLDALQKTVSVNKLAYSMIAAHNGDALDVQILNADQLKMRNLVSQFALISPMHPPSKVMLMDRNNSRTTMRPELLKFIHQAPNVQGV